MKKITEFGKNVFDSRQLQKCIDGGSSVSLALLTCLRNNKLFFFFEIFTKLDMMSEEFPELSRK